MLHDISVLLLWNPWLMPVPLLAGIAIFYATKFAPFYITVLSVLFLGLPALWIGATAIGGFEEVPDIFDRRFPLIFLAATLLFLLGGAWGLARRRGQKQMT